MVSQQGHILTSLHVVVGASAIRLTFPDGSRTDAAVVVEEPADDIAVLQARSVPAGVPPATLGNPGAVRVGDEAFVVGSPFGLVRSLTAGVVSGLDRQFRMPDSDVTLSGLIQVELPSRQRLLEAATTELRLRRLEGLLGREIDLLNRDLKPLVVEPRVATGRQN